ncbi:hypothetical protein METSCH_C04430 [Metschnikowia aff. pulcherrima]|uniref:Uncharacterized protein n=1 Tax=Metschnikowia aff. pulcherrima TaxID=2163413 RepID=A0A4P6XP98_9ASCO|nr:hypothetical protein METSCH_C04430 [Metschnikowia aff. pulcherrima]
MTKSPPKTLNKEANSCKSTDFLQSGCLPIDLTIPPFLLPSPELLPELHNHMATFDYPTKTTNDFFSKKDTEIELANSNHTTLIRNIAKDLKRSESVLSNHIPNNEILSLRELSATSYKPLKNAQGASLRHPYRDIAKNSTVGPARSQQIPCPTLGALVSTQNEVRNSSLTKSTENAGKTKRRDPVKDCRQNERKSSRNTDSENERLEVSRRKIVAAEGQFAQKEALKDVMAAERDRQRVIRNNHIGHHPPRDEYTIADNNIPPYRSQLHRYLDLVSYDERFGPVLRVNRHLVHGDNDLHAAIARLTRCNLLPQNTDLWHVSHVDDRDYETMIPALIPIADFFS